MNKISLLLLNHPSYHLTVPSFRANPAPKASVETKVLLVPPAWLDPPDPSVRSVRLVPLVLTASSGPLVFQAAPETRDPPGPEDRLDPQDPLEFP